MSNPQPYQPNYGDYYEGLLSIVSDYYNNKELAFEMITKYKSPVMILNSVYFYLLGRNEIPALEENKEVQADLWIRSEFKNTYSERMAFCRAHYLLEII